MSAGTCPECAGDLIRNGAFCPDCGWDAALEADADHEDGLDLPTGYGRDEAEEEWDHAQTLERERLGAPRPFPATLALLALVIVAAVLAPVLAAFLR